MNEIITPNENDVLLGRGGRVFKHAGNKKLRDLATLYFERYNTARKADKTLVAKDVVEQVQNLHPPGRFLKKKVDGLSYCSWVGVPYEVAVEKVSQVIRDIRRIDCTTSSSHTAFNQSVGSKRKHSNDSPSATDYYPFLPSKKMVKTSISCYQDLSPLSLTNTMSLPSASAFHPTSHNPHNFYLSSSCDTSNHQILNHQKNITMNRAVGGNIGNGTNHWNTTGGHDFLQYPAAKGSTPLTMLRHKTVPSGNPQHNSQQFTRSRQVDEFNREFSNKNDLLFVEQFEQSAQQLSLRYGNRAQY